VTRRILAAEPTGASRRLRLTFAPVHVGEVTIADDGTAAAKALDNPGVLAQVKLDETTGGLEWPNGYKLSPELLYKATDPAGDADPAAGDKNKGFTTPALLGTIVSGLGVLGFVTFAGGVILWSRFNEMGIPADHALGLVTKSELVSTGADFLVPAFLIAGGVVLVVVLLSATIEFFKAWSPLRWGLTPTVIGLAELAVVIWLTQSLPGGALAVLVGVIAVGALAISSGARLNFGLFALAIFFAVGSFAIARTYELTTHDLKVLPMAYSRTQPGEATRVETGYFVAETSDRVLFASVPKAVMGKNPVPNELREFPRSETDDLEIGELARPGQAESIAARFAYNLCERLAHLTPAPSARPTTVPSRAVAPTSGAVAICPRSYLKELAEKAGVEWVPDRAELAAQRRRERAEAIRSCRSHKRSHRARKLCERRMRKRFASAP
jgi:hypothetical protein